MNSTKDEAGEFEGILPYTIVLGDSPVRNRVQKWLRDVWGLSQDAESGNIVAKLLLSNIAALAKHVRTLRRDQGLLAQNTTANGDQLTTLQKTVDLLELRLSYYEHNCESIRFQRKKLDAVIATEQTPEPVIEEMCPICMEPMKAMDLIKKIDTTIGPLEAHAACVTKLEENITLTDASGNAIKQAAASTSASLARMDEVDSEEGQG